MQPQIEFIVQKSFAHNPGASSKRFLGPYTMCKSRMPRLEFAELDHVVFEVITGLEKVDLWCAADAQISPDIALNGNQDTLPYNASWHLEFHLLNEEDAQVQFVHWCLRYWKRKQVRSGLCCVADAQAPPDIIFILP